MPTVRPSPAIAPLCLGLAVLACSSAPRPSSGSAPDADRVQTSPACVPRDSADRTLYATLGPAADTAGDRVLLTADRAEELGVALTALLADWRMPPLSLAPDWSDRQLLANRFHDALALSPSDRLTLLLEVSEEGRVRVARETPSDLPAVDSAVRAAIDSANVRAALWFLTVGDTMRAGEGSAEALRLVVRSAPDSLRPTARLGVIRLPQFELVPAMPAPGGPPIPYPDDLWRQNVQGRVVAEFVVRENGRPDMRTFHVVRTSHPGFTRAVRDHLPRMRFASAIADGCPVAMRIQMPFNFRLY